MNDALTPDDIAYMRRALELAKNGEGRVAPNPPVGCVLVKNGVVVGEGWHDRYGDLHAEAMALRNAGPDAAGSVAYVTLSPCTTTGKQPPCADALAAAGVREVVIAAVDANPRNADALERLRELGVPYRVGLLREEAEFLARGFLKRQKKGVPYITLKYAMTLDGKIAAVHGDSRWVSSEASRERVQEMRSRSDAVMVGIGTALADDPLLTVRDTMLARRGGNDRHPQPWRIILDSHCRLPVTAKMFDSNYGPAEKILVASCLAPGEPRARALAGAGAEIIHAPGPGNGKINLKILLGELSRRGIDMILCEGGGEVAASLLKERLLDEITAFIAPKIIGGRDAASPVNDLGLIRMDDAVPLAIREIIPSGSDIMVRADVIADDA